MKISEKQRKYLLDTTLEIQFELGTLIEKIDSEEEALAAGAIIKYLSSITAALIHGETEEVEIEELFF